MKSFVVAISVTILLVASLIVGAHLWHRYDFDPKTALELAGKGSTGLLELIGSGVLLLGLCLAVTWIFLPWIVMFRLGRIIELLEQILRK